MTLVELARLSPAPEPTPVDPTPEPVAEAPKKCGRPASRGALSAEPKVKHVSEGAGEVREEPKPSVRTSDLDAAKVFMERCGHLFVRQSNKQV